jgi:hypothetical protein
MGVTPSFVSSRNVFETPMVPSADPRLRSRK